jgi:hypothetical protein
LLGIFHKFTIPKAMELVMEPSDELYRRADAANAEGQPMVMIGLRIGQQIKELFGDSLAESSVTVYGPLREKAECLMRGLEIATSWSHAQKKIVWKQDHRYRVVSTCSGQEARFEILNSLLNLVDEGAKNGQEETVASQISELPDDEIYLLTVEEWSG